MNQPPLGATPATKAHGQDRAAEQVAPVAIGGQPREGEIAGAENLGRQVDRYALDHRNGEQEQHHRPVHGEDLVVGLGIHEVPLRASRAARGSACRARRRLRRTRTPCHQAQADDGMVDRRETLQARARWPRSRRVRGAAASPCRPAAVARSGHSLSLFPCCSRLRERGGEVLCRWTMTSNRIPVWPRPQNSLHSAW